MRRVAITTVLCAALAVFGLAPTASADPPVEIVDVRELHNEMDPCTGEPMDVTLTFNVGIHTHRNNTIFIVDLHSVTSTGYVGRGHETFVTTKNRISDVANWVNVNAETGARFLHKVRIKVDLRTGEVDRTFEFTCTRPPS